MKLGIMQPYFFPYLGYWQLINAVDKYVVYDDVNFIKGGWISRNRILLNGQSHMITLPLDKASPFKLINEIAMTSNMAARNKTIKTITAAYIKAPYFDNVMPVIERLIYNNDNIAMLNYHSIQEINNYLGIATEIVLSSSLQKDNNLKGKDKVLEINKLLNSDVYYNAIGGMELYNAEEFKENGITLQFLKMKNHTYEQLHYSFVPGLSIIDVLMFNPIEHVKNLLEQYDLQ